MWTFRRNVHPSDCFLEMPRQGFSLFSLFLLYRWDRRQPLSALWKILSLLLKALQAPYDEIWFLTLVSKELLQLHISLRYLWGFKNILHQNNHKTYPSFQLSLLNLTFSLYVRTNRSLRSNRITRHRCVSNTKHVRTLNTQKSIIISSFNAPRKCSHIFRRDFYTYSNAKKDIKA